jgi:hypothetical protein
MTDLSIVVAGYGLTCWFILLLAEYVHRVYSKVLEVRARRIQE